MQRRSGTTVYLWLSDLVVLIHFGFVLFVIAGGVLVLRWWQVLILHLPAITWGAVVEFAHWICPLTYLEDYLRVHAGAAAYSGDFVTHYLLPILYPAQLTGRIQIALGALVIVINAIVYGLVIWFWRRRRLRRDQTETPVPR